MSQRESASKLSDKAVGWIGLPLLTCLTAGLVSAQEDGSAVSKPDWHSARAVATPAALTLNLAECVEVALQRQPRLAAQRASLAAALDGQRALEALWLAALVDREIPVRRRQAALGVTAAAAAVEEAERQTVYAVTRTYFTVLYAREQESVASGIVDRLGAIRDAAKRQLDEGAADVTSADVSRTTTYVHLAQVKKIQAAQGAKRALAALREAIGLEPDACLDVPAGSLPESEARPDRCQVVAWALARRGDLVRATVLADVAGLEVGAQETSHRLRMETFAAGSDLHASPVPHQMHNTEYRPGAVAPEVPAMLGGSRPERVKHAQTLHGRARAGAEVARNLIALEAEEAFLRWEEASQAAREARQAADSADELAGGLSKDRASGIKVRVEDLANAWVLASQARSQYNELRYREILALADLERITAGALCARLTETAARPAQSAPQKKPAEDKLFPTRTP
jgi:outer membrane protein TolC